MQSTMAPNSTVFRYGALKQIQNSDGCKPVDLAVANGHHDVVDTLDHPSTWLTQSE